MTIFYSILSYFFVEQKKKQCFNTKKCKALSMTACVRESESSFV